MAYTVPHTWVAGDFIRASWLNLTTTDLVDHETRIVALEASGSGNVNGQASSVDSEVALFSGTGGKTIKRATGTGYVKVASGVMASPVATVPTSDLSGTIALATQVSGNLPLANLPTNFAQIFKATATFTDAQVKALPTGAQTIVAAPAAGLTLVPHLVLLFAKFAAGAYTNVDAALSIFVNLGSETWSGYIANDAGSTPALTYATTFCGAANKRWVFREWVDGTAPTAGWGSLSTPLQFQTASGMTLVAGNGGSGNFTGGNAANSLTVITYYSLETAP